METSKKRKMVLIGIAGTPKDFLLSLHILKCFLHQNKDIKNNLNILIKQYYYIPKGDMEERCNNIIKEIDEIKPDITGFSCYVWNMDAVKYISERIKNTKIIMGGPEIVKQDIINKKFDKLKADFLIFGEAEKPFESLIKSILFNKENLENIKGLAFKKNNIFFCNPNDHFIEDLKTQPSPYLEGFVSDEILSRPDIRVNIETQRGCNFRCAYCLYHKSFPKIRYRKAETVAKEIEFAYKKKVKMGRILDANFLSDKQFAKKIIRALIERKIKMALFFEMLPQFLDEEMAQLFGEYKKISPENRVMAGIGIQTITQEALAVIKRQIPVKFFEKAFNLLQKENVIIKSDIILGLPRETKESYFKTLEFIIEKMHYGTNYLSLALLRVLPGTDLVEIAEKEKIVIDKSNSSYFVYETPTLPRKDMIECLRLNTVAFRLLSSIDIKGRMKLRDLYFDVKDALKITNLQLLQYFAKEFFSYLKEKNTDFVKPDFPNAEYYSSKTVYEDIPDGWLIEKLKTLKKAGLFKL